MNAQPEQLTLPHCPVPVPPAPATIARLKVKRDPDPVDPRKEYDNLGTMVCHHKRYQLGDEVATCFDSENFNSWEELEAEIVKRQDPAAILPVFLFDHSGLSLSTGGFSCPWDSGQVGFIFVSKAKARAECDWKLITKKRREQLEGYLRNEVETYDAYLRGDCWGYVVEKAELPEHCVIRLPNANVPDPDQVDELDLDELDWQEEDSCWGFLGYEDDGELAACIKGCVGDDFTMEQVLEAVQEKR